MTIIGIGIDIVEINRLSKSIERFGSRLSHRILSVYEYTQYQVHKQPVHFLAKRFAVKEATLKAFGTGISKGLSFKHIEVYSDILGKPKLRFFQKAKIIANHLKAKKVHVTLTDERHYACAVVIIENN